MRLLQKASSVTYVVSFLMIFFITGRDSVLAGKYGELPVDFIVSLILAGFLNFALFGLCYAFLWIKEKFGPTDLE